MKIKQQLKSVIDHFRENAPELLVVGPPRSGFTLLISVLNHLLITKKYRRNPLREELAAIVPEASEDIYQCILKYFSSHISPEDLIISPDFKWLLGGPKWLNKENRNLACIRKYVGIRNMGDFLAVFSLPKCVMDHDRVIHSHYEPDVWLEDTYYRNHVKFASIRDPLDVINSSVFSLNALTGEYIDRYLKVEAGPLRDQLAMYKLTDPNFLEGLIAPLKDYLEKFNRVREQYAVMRWEDLITNPQETIVSIGERAGIKTSQTSAAKIWGEMKNRNQTAHHRHNFRKGIIGDWKNHFVNQHLEIIRRHGFDHFMEDLGYGRIQYLDKKAYTPFQKKVEAYLEAGRIYDQFEDRNLFTFAFNKSNFQSPKYAFSQYKSERGTVVIERSTIKEDGLMQELVVVLEKALEPVNQTIESICARYHS